MNLPTEKQIEHCAGMGWRYIGDGLFARGDVVGYFTDQGFKKE